MGSVEKCDDMIKKERKTVRRRARGYRLPPKNSLEAPLEEAAPLRSCLGTWQAGQDWGTGLAWCRKRGAGQRSVSDLYLGPAGLWMMSRVQVPSEGSVAPG